MHNLFIYKLWRTKIIQCKTKITSSSAVADERSDHLNQGVTLTFDLQHLARSSIGTNAYSLQVSLRLLK